MAGVVTRLLRQFRTLRCQAAAALASVRFGCFPVCERLVSRRALAAPLKELKERRKKVKELCSKVRKHYGLPMKCDRLRDASELSWYMKLLTAAHMETPIFANSGCLRARPVCRAV